MVKKSKVEQSLTAAITSKIKSSYQFRRVKVCNLFKDDLFQREHSISEDQNTLCHGTKFFILKRLNSTEKPNLNLENLNAIIFDLSAIVRSKSKPNCLTFDDFANYVYRIIMLMSKNYERCEIVADRYFEGSLKEGTKNKRRAESSKLIFNGESLMPKDFSSNFLASSENKENLNIFLAKKFVDFHKNSSQVLVVTLNDGVCSNKDYVFTEELIAYCNVEEVDARLIQHGINVSKQRYKNILIHTVDSDVLLLSIAYGNKMTENGNEFINVNLGTGLDATTCDVIQLRDMIGHHRSLALPFFQAFTSCDTTSSFYRYGKCKFWGTWMREDPEVTSTFIELSNAPTEIREDQICKIDNFLVSIYYPGQ